ncbi:phospholipase A2 inhibitor subunit gamma B-like isoform X1 [Xenopus tropicalis]|uniref:Phospholipase A2 inhibitor subunit gamma B-like isoform X1 n=2 Tax=Xenopus tropicalis TaxID=8364 RepID=A0A8J1JXN1_XENTR|nr:phospholipase A2 inhibitor subunit gamma B-like isoform X1 [Xenopus tropicalis]
MWCNLRTMRSAVGLLGALGVLLPTVCGLSCVACLEVDSRVCDGGSVLCPPEQVCSTSLVEVTRKDGLKYYNVRRNCRYPERCEITFHFSHTNYRMRQKVTCCTTDNCTPPEPTWLEVEDESETNGLSCPTCVYPSFDCLAQRDVECVGEENKCYHQTQTYQGSGGTRINTFRGCGTESLCRFGEWAENYGGFTLETTINCTDANTGNANMSP